MTVDITSERALPPRVRAVLEDTAKRFRTTAGELLSRSNYPELHEARLYAAETLSAMGFSTGQIAYWMDRSKDAIRRSMRKPCAREAGQLINMRAQR